MADKCAEDEVLDRLHESCAAFGVPPTMDPAVLSSNLRPVIPRQLRDLQLSPDHFQTDGGFGQRTFNEILSLILIQSESMKILKDSRNPSWVYDVQSCPDNSRYVGPSSMTKM